MSNHTHNDPAILTTSPGAAYFHHHLELYTFRVSRVYHQLKVWKNLSNSDLEQLNWSWHVFVKDHIIISIMTEYGWKTSSLLPNAAAKVHATNAVLTVKPAWSATLRAKSVTVVHTQICQLILMEN